MAGKYRNKTSMGKKTQTTAKELAAPEFSALMTGVPDTFQNTLETEAISGLLKQICVKTWMEKKQ